MTEWHTANEIGTAEPDHGIAIKQLQLKADELQAAIGALGGDESGGSQPVTNQQFYGNPVACPFQSNANLTFDSPTYDALFDNSDDAGHPIVITPGTYAVTVYVQPQADMTEGTNYDVALQLAIPGRDAFSKQTSAAATTDNPRPSLTVSKTYYIAAAGGIECQLTSQDVAEPTFAIVEADIQRIS